MNPLIGQVGLIACPWPWSEEAAANRGHHVARAQGGGEMASMNVARECVASLADASQGWQHFASNIVEELQLRGALPALPPQQRALQTVVRVLPVFTNSQSSRSSPSVCCFPLAPPLSSRNCRCGGPLDCLGHHWSACAVCCRGRHFLDLNVFVRDLDLGPFNHFDGRRLGPVGH